MEVERARLSVLSYLISILSAKLGMKGIDCFIEAILFPIGRALECSKLVTEFLDGFVEIRYIFVRRMWIPEMG